MGPEFIGVDDYHHLIEALVVCATKLDTASIPSLREKMGKLLKRNRAVLTGP